MSDLEYEVVSAGLLDHPARLVDIFSNGFLDKDILAAGETGHRDLVVCRCGGDEAEGVTFREQVLIIPKIRTSEPARDLSAPLFIPVGDPHEDCVVQLRIDARMVLTEIADTDHAHTHSRFLFHG
jgi:hypothetical protein